ncbi:MAG: DNA repair protein RecO [Bacteroidetes bacterium]|nr:DNA repair protein RecO [Bacteroidota bacterium]
MLYKTRGIVLHSIKYSETSLIVKAYTETFGLQSYLLKGARSPKSKIRPVLFQPLTLLDLVVYNKEKSTLHSIKEVKPAAHFHSIPSDIRKSSIVLFLAELIYKSIREEEPNSALFEFLWHSLLLLENIEEPFSSFHLLFAIKLSRYLGFQPQQNRSEYNRFFHLREGSFQSVFNTHDDCMDETQSVWLFRLMKTDLDQLSLLNIPAKIRNPLLDKILVYYQSHLPGRITFRSHEVLHTVLA